MTSNTNKERSCPILLDVIVSFRINKSQTMFIWAVSFLSFSEKQTLLISLSTDAANLVTWVFLIIS